MTAVLDTSAIIGWLERVDSTVPDLLEGADTVRYHPVSVGELHAGVERAGSDAERDMRQNTLQFTVARLEAVTGPVLAGEHFGFLTAHFSRKLSHNDYWILASAIASPGLTLMTEDQKLFALVASEEFAAVIARRGWVPPGCRLAESMSVS